MRQLAFEKDGRFYRGNLHTHTELSDGKRPVSEVVGIYKKLGYDFLAVTDHYRVFKSTEYNDELYIVPGMEIHSIKEGSDKTHHTVVLTTYDNEKVYHGQRFENVSWTDAKTACDDLCSTFRPLGFDMIYCHSLWSRAEPEEFDNPDFMAMEVYNGVCDVNFGQGIQDLHWDKILRGGRKLWGVASDDCHGGDNHYGVGYIMLKTDELNDRNILESLREGAFYASQGPEIHDFHIDGDRAYIRCSPAARITFISYERRGFSFKFDSPETEASIVFQPDIDYIRAEVTDEEGRKAWTNPIFLK